MVTDPVTVGPDATIAQLDELCGHYKVSGLPVVDAGGNLQGIITNRDLRFVPPERWASLTVRECMTPRDRLITGETGISREDAKALLAEHRIEKLPLVDAEGRLTGLITVPPTYPSLRGAPAHQPTGQASKESRPFFSEWE